MDPETPRATRPVVGDRAHRGGPLQGQRRAHICPTGEEGEGVRDDGRDSPPPALAALNRDRACLEVQVLWPDREGLPKSDSGPVEESDQGPVPQAGPGLGGAFREELKFLEMLEYVDSTHGSCSKAADSCAAGTRISLSSQVRPRGKSASRSLSEANGAMKHRKYEAPEPQRLFWVSIPGPETDPCFRERGSVRQNRLAKCGSQRSTSSR